MKQMYSNHTIFQPPRVALRLELSGSRNNHTHYDHKEYRNHPTWFMYCFTQLFDSDSTFVLSGDGSVRSQRSAAGDSADLTKRQDKGMLLVYLNQRF